MNKADDDDSKEKRGSFVINIKNELQDIQQGIVKQTKLLYSLFDNTCLCQQVKRYLLKNGKQTTQDKLQLQEEIVEFSVAAGAALMDMIVKNEGEGEKNVKTYICLKFWSSIYKLITKNLKASKREW